MRKNGIIPMLLFCFTHVMLGQETIRIDLQINTNYEQRTSISLIEFGEENRAATEIGMAPGGIQVTKTRLSDNEYALQFGSATDQRQTYTIKVDSSIVVWIERQTASGPVSLPYTVIFDHYTTRDGTIEKILRWNPHYRAEGVFKYGSCESLIGITERNGDGVFDIYDYSRGTNIQIDIDNDGRIYGKGEWIDKNQIIEYCGKHFVIDSIAVDGSFITLSESNLPILKMGDKVPQFVEQTIDGATISAESLLGTNYLIDFWASWCVVCIQKFPEVQQLDKELKDELKIIAVNVDTKSYIPKAMKTIEKYELTWPHIMNGKGKQDPLWRVFGSNTDFRFSIPLYVLVDKNGKIAYIGHGGDELAELTTAINSLSTKFSNKSAD